MSVKVAPAPGEMAKGSWLDTNVFTDIAFETGCGLLQLEERHVYVTSISGAVYQVGLYCAIACNAMLCQAMLSSLTLPLRPPADFCSWKSGISMSPASHALCIRSA